MRRFVTVWLGQLLSILGSGLSGFALGVWVYQEQGSVTRFGLVMLCVTVPGIIAAPFAGSLVDRWSRRRVMLCADIAAAVSTSILLVAYLNDALVYGLILAASAVTSVAGAFQQPAWLAAASLLVPKRHLGRANGMTSLSTAMSGIISPLVGGALLVTTNLSVVLVIDLITFSFALGTLLMVRFPEPDTSDKPPAHPMTLLREAYEGWRYIRARPGLFGLLLFSMPFSFRLGFIHVLTTPLVLSLTDAATLGVVLAVGGVGMVAGSVFMIAWGGPERRAYGMLAAGAANGAALVVACLQPSVVLFGAASFLFFFSLPIANACLNTIWQTKVDAGLQGRVFGIKRLIAWLALPAGQLLAGPLAENVFEPAMMPGGGLASSVGAWIGVGEGRGMALMFGLLGIATLMLISIGVAWPRIRRLDIDLPDVSLADAARVVDVGASEAPVTP
ncbi:MAG: MFS transporter [Acidobacteriota bacterium]